MIKANQTKIASIRKKLTLLEKNITDCINTIGDKSLLTKVDKTSKKIYNIDQDYQEYLNLKTPTDLLPVPEDQHDYTVNADLFNKSADSISAISSDVAISTNLHLGKVIGAFASILDKINTFETTEDIKLKKFSNEYENSIMNKLVTSIGSLPDVGESEYPKMTGVVMKELEQPEDSVTPEGTVPEKSVEQETVPGLVPPGDGKDIEEQKNQKQPSNPDPNQIPGPILPEASNENEEDSENNSNNEGEDTEENNPSDETIIPGDIPESNSKFNPIPSDNKGEPGPGDEPNFEEPIKGGSEDEDKEETKPTGSSETEDNPFDLPKLKGSQDTNIPSGNNPDGKNPGEDESNNINGIKEPFGGETNQEATTGSEEENDVETPSDSSNQEQGNNNFVSGVNIVYPPGSKIPADDDINNNPFAIGREIPKNPKDDMNAFLGIDGSTVRGIEDPKENDGLEKLNLNSTNIENTNKGDEAAIAGAAVIGATVIGTTDKKDEDDHFHAKNTGKKDSSIISTKSASDDEDDVEKKRRRIAEEIRKRVRTALILTGTGIVATVLSCIFVGTGVLNPFIFIAVGVATIVAAFLFGFNRYLDHLFNLGNAKARVRIFSEIKQNIKDSLVLTGVGIVSSIVTYILATINLLNPICFAVAGLMTIIMAVLYAYNKYLHKLTNIDSLINESILSEANKELLREFFKSKNGFNLKILVLLVVLLFVFILKLLGKLSWLWLLILLLILLIILLIIVIGLAKNEEKKTIEK